MKPHEPDWPPDWRTPVAYPNSAEVTGSHWAWEFLRRNPKYQADYEKLQKTRSKLVKMWRTLEATKGLSIIKTKGKPKNIRDKEEERDRLIDAMWASYGIIKGLVPPSPSAKIYIDIFELTAMYHYGSHSDKKPDEVILKFDLTMPIDRQLRMAKTILLSNQFFEVADIRHRTDLFPQYLRLLDANDCGATQDEMSRVLYPGMENTHPDFKGRDHVKKALKSAMRLRDADYRLLPLP